MEPQVRRLTQDDALQEVLRILTYVHPQEADRYAADRSDASFLLSEARQAHAFLVKKIERPAEIYALTLLPEPFHLEPPAHMKGHEGWLVDRKVTLQSGDGSTVTGYPLMQAKRLLSKPPVFFIHDPKIYIGAYETIPYIKDPSESGPPPASPSPAWRM